MHRTPVRPSSAPSAPVLQGGAERAPAPVLAGGARPTFAAPPPPVIQRITGGEGLDDIAIDVSNVEQLSSEDIALRLQHLQTHRDAMHWTDPRQRRVENMTHILSRQQVARAENRPHLITRIVAPEQVHRPNRGTNTVRTSPGSLERNLGAEGMVGQGGGETFDGRFYNYMRGYGGAGFQGFHTDNGSRPESFHGVLNKIATDRPSQGSKGPKLSMVAVDRRQIRDRLFDPANPEARARFVNRPTPSGRFKGEGMYDSHVAEGVVAYDGLHADDVGKKKNQRQVPIPLSAVKGFRSFRVRGSDDMDEGEEAITHEESSALLEHMLDISSGEPEPMFEPHGPFKRRKRDDEDHDMGDDGLKA
jgi:hypothetical protein